MRITLAAVSARRGAAKSAEAESLTADYIRRASKLQPVETEVFESEPALLRSAERVSGQNGRAAAWLALFDPAGETMTSEEFAQSLARLRDRGTQRLLLAIGPADGWSAAALARADWRVSLGRMTLPHELARVVAAEQIYRALTILSGHPYHTGH